MSPPPDEMISWVVEKVALSGAEGGMIFLPCFLHAFLQPKFNLCMHHKRKPKVVQRPGWVRKKDSSSYLIEALLIVSQILHLRCSGRGVCLLTFSLFEMSDSLAGVSRDLRRESTHCATVDGFDDLWMMRDCL
jgi:hypothetical protein